MGKKRKQFDAQHGRVHSAKKPRRQHSDAPRAKRQHPSQPVRLLQKKKKSSKNPTNPQQRPVIPFAPWHSILLVGEGDLSFAASLVTCHKCTSIRAGVLEKSKEELLQKYPHAGKNIDVVEEAGGCVIFGLDATKMAPFLAPKRRIKKSKNKYLSGGDEKAQASKERRKENDDGLGDDEGGCGDSDQDDNIATRTQHHTTPKPPGTPLIDRILFNFPHVGGKSTDVNRQVRANQFLLVQFFERAIPSLAPGGRIVVTLFEGEPYSLWNVRDLGRHAGLVVERSFQFQASAFPGYRHARTLGVVKKGGVNKKKLWKNRRGKDGGGESEDDDGTGGHDGGDEEKEEWKDGDDEEEEWEESTTAWRGEDRPARSYVFILKDDEMAAKTELAGGEKEEKGEGSSDEGDD